MQDESLQQCMRCCNTLANDVIGNKKSVVYCAACSLHGRGPPLLSGNRHTNDSDSIDSVELYNNRGMLPVVDTDGQARTHMLSDMPRNVLHNSAGDSDGSNLNLGSSSNFCSSVMSHSVESDDVSESQLLDSQCVSPCRPQQSLVTKLREQMEMLARDENIAVHCNIASEDEDSASCQSDVNKGDFDNSLMKSRQHYSDSVTVLSSRYVKDVDDGLFIADVHQATRPKNQQQLDNSFSDVPLSSELVTSGHYMAFNSAKGNVVQDGCYNC